MGVKDFYKLFNGTNVNINSLKDSKISVDAYSIIYSAIGAKFKLTDKEGNDTSHLMVIINILSLFYKNNITSIWVFDYFDHDEALQTTTDIEDLKKETKQIRSLKKTFDVPKKVLNEVVQLLHMFGVTTIITPKHIEAECICALLNSKIKDSKGEPVCNYVYSGDSDVLVFGAQKQLRRYKNQYIVYNIDEIKRANEIDFDQFVRICVALGTDFAPKVTGVGIKTVINKIKNNKVTFNDRQIKVIELFKNQCNWFNFTLIETTTNIAAIENTFDWLVEKGFNRNSLIKKFKW